MNRPILSLILFFNLLVSFLVRISEPTDLGVTQPDNHRIKQKIVAINKDITLMWYYNDPTLLHQTNIHTYKLCKNNRQIFILINVWSQYSQLKRFILSIFSPEHKLSIQMWYESDDFKIKVMKNRWYPPILSNMLDNCRWGIGGKNWCENQPTFKQKNRWCIIQPIFMSHQSIKKKLADYHRFAYRW